MRVPPDDTRRPAGGPGNASRQSPSSKLDLGSDRGGAVPGDEASSWSSGPLRFKVYGALAKADWVGAARLVEDNWPELISYHLPVVRAVADALPEEFLAENPRWISARQYLSHLLLSPRLRPPSYTRVAPKIPPTRPVDIVTQTTEASIEARSRGDFEVAAGFATDALAYLDTNPAIAAGAGAQLLPTLLHQLGMSFELAAKDDRAIAVFQRSYSNAVIAGDVRAAANSTGELAWIHALAGRRRAADEWTERHLALTSASPSLRLLRTTIHLAKASALLDALDFDGARRELDHTDSDALAEHWAATAAGQAMLDAYARRADTWELLGELNSAVAARPANDCERGLGRFLLDDARAVTLISGGLAERALPILDAAVDQGGERLLLGRRAAAHYALGEFDAAEQDADEIIRTPRIWPRVLTSGLAVKAATTWRRGDRRAAVETFRQAVGLGLSNRLLLSLAVVPHEDFVALRQLAYPGRAPAGLSRLEGRTAAFARPVSGLAKLTAQEARVLTELAGGGTILQAARRLEVSENTVKTQTRSIYRKLRVGSRAEMLAEAMRRGLI